MSTSDDRPPLTIHDHPVMPGDGTVTIPRIPVPDGMAQEIVDFLFASKLWHEDVNIVHAKVRQFKQRIRAAHAETLAASDWGARAYALRHPADGGEPLSWRKIAEALGQPLTSVRRAVTELEKQKAA